MIREFNGKSPKLASSAFVSETAYIAGDVEIGEKSNIWPGAVIRGDLGKITIGNNTSIEDNCVVHSAIDMIIGDNTIVGHGAILHCKNIGNNVLIGNNATVLDNAEIGDYCIIAAGSVVAPDTKIPEESLAVGTPAQVKGKLSQKQRDYINMSPAFNIKLAEEYKKQGL
ncbi:MAG: gamma carbonic anhydrase family protein [Syntrophales bacterium]|jgi:carbonic anhydrase/acetyltransferase-like protein (isoleucine patch superfamily)